MLCDRTDPRSNYKHRGRSKAARRSSLSRQVATGRTPAAILSAGSTRGVERGCGRGPSRPRPPSMAGVILRSPVHFRTIASRTASGWTADRYADPSLRSPWPAAGPRVPRHEPCAGDASLGNDDLVPRSRFLHGRGCVLALYRFRTLATERSWGPLASCSSWSNIGAGVAFGEVRRSPEDWRHRGPEEAAAVVKALPFLYRSASTQQAIGGRPVGDRQVGGRQRRRSARSAVGSVQDGGPDEKVVCHRRARVGTPGGRIG